MTNGNTRPAWFIRAADQRGAFKFPTLRSPWRFDASAVRIRGPRFRFEAPDTVGARQQSRRHAETIRQQCRDRARDVSQAHSGISRRRQLPWSESVRLRRFRHLSLHRHAGCQPSYTGTGTGILGKPSRSLGVYRAGPSDQRPRVRGDAHARSIARAHRQRLGRLLYSGHAKIASPRIRHQSCFSQSCNDVLRLSEHSHEDGTCVAHTGRAPIIRGPRWRFDSYQR